MRLWNLLENAARSTLKGPGPERFTFTERRTIQAHSQDVRALRFSPVGHLLASAGHEGTACVWRVSDGAQLFNLTEHGRDVRSVAFSPDGKLLATAGGDSNNVIIWDAQTGKDLVTLDHTDYVWSVAFSCDGKTLVTAGDDAVRIWKAEKK